MRFDLQRKFNSKQQFLTHHLCLWLHNKPADIYSGLENGQRLDSRLPRANSKPVSNLSKAVFFRPWHGRRRDQRIVRLRAEGPLSLRVGHVPCKREIELNEKQAWLS